MLSQHLPACKIIILGGMRDSKMPVRLSALRACVSLLSELSESDREHMKDAVPLMFDILGVAFHEGDEETIVRAVTALTNLADVTNDDNSGVAPGAKFLRHHIKPILTAMVTMCSSEKLESETRRVCLEFLLTLADNGKGMIRKQGEFAQAVIPLAFKFLTELQHTPAWEDPNAVAHGDDDDGYDNYKMGLEAIERLSDSLGGKIFLSVTIPIIQRASKDSNWNVRHAALVTIAKMANGCAQHLEDKLPDILKNFIVPFALNDPHYRVRWAAVDLIAHLASAFEPYFANTFLQPVLDTLLACMQPSNHWRVIANACLAFPDVGRGLEHERLVPFVPKYLEALVPLLNMLQYPKVVENALAALSTVAAVIGTDFIPYYDAFMPGVKNLIMTCTGDHTRMVRTKSIEAIGMIAQAVEGDKFRPELGPMMDALLKMLHTNLPSDDPQHGEIVTTMARICRSVKQEFVPYLPLIMPGLLKSARITDACVIVNDGEFNPYKDREGWDTVEHEVRQVGKQQVSRNSSLLEEKARAFRMIFEYCNTLGSSFMPWVKESAELIITCVRYQFNSNVRENCVASLPAVMRCVKSGLESNPSEQMQQCMDLFQMMWQPLTEAMAVEPDLECLGDIVSSCADVVKELPGPLVETQYDELNTLIFRLMADLLGRCKQRDEHSRSVDFDEAQQELFAIENEAEDEFLGQVYFLINALVKNGSSKYLESFERTLRELYMAMLKSDDLTLRTNAICVIAQVMEDNPNHTLSKAYCEPLYLISMESAEDEHVALMQSCMFGLGVCSMVMKDGFGPQADATMQLLHKVINNKDLDPNEYGVATDNAISSLGKIFIHTYNMGLLINGLQRCSSGVQAIMSGWVNYLPCCGDEIEAQKIHEMLTQFVSSNNPIIMGPEMRHLPIVLGIFGQILARPDWEEICTPETKGRMVTIFQQIQTGMPRETVQRLIQAMSEEQREAFKPYIIA